jgi:hypothetical protein
MGRCIQELNELKKRVDNIDDLEKGADLRDKSEIVRGLIKEIALILKPGTALLPTTEVANYIFILMPDGEEIPTNLYFINGKLYGEETGEFELGSISEVGNHVNWNVVEDDEALISEYFVGEFVEKELKDVGFAEKLQTEEGVPFCVSGFGGVIGPLLMDAGYEIVEEEGEKYLSKSYDLEASTLTTFPVRN